MDDSGKIRDSTWYDQQLVLWYWNSVGLMNLFWWMIQPIGVAGIGPTFLGISPGKAHFFQLANPFKSTPTNDSNCFNLVCTTSRFALQFWIGTMLSSARLQYLVSSSLRQFDQCLIHVYIYYIYIIIYCIYCIYIYYLYYIYTVQSHKLDIWNTQHQRTSTHLLKGLKGKIA